MTTKRIILTAVAAATAVLLLRTAAVLVRETLTKQPSTRDQTDDMRHRHREVPATDFAPRSHGSQSGDGGPPS